MPSAEEILRSAYQAFNERKISAATELMHPDINWPNAWEGGRVVGRRAVQNYWIRQFERISSEVEPLAFSDEPGGTIRVDVHQVVRDANTGQLMSDSLVRHSFRLKDGLIVRMDVVDDGAIGRVE